ncbi:LemA family protein [Frateuria sp.]|uniref:LemA family protein n=1 Tax=Frateuria sp. TaxID=2211372 RepID=UPI003F7E5E95
MKTQPPHVALDAAGFGHAFPASGKAMMSSSDLESSPMIKRMLFAVAIALAIVYLVFLFNNLIALRHNVRRAWANIDILLKQRSEELSKLVEICKQYMAYEQHALAQIMEARAEVARAGDAGDVGRVGRAEHHLRHRVQRVLALAEGYPALQADTVFAGLQSRVSVLECSIADRRLLYNETVNRLNTRRLQFPDLLVARLGGIGPASLLQFTSPEVTQRPSAPLFE